MSHDKTLAQRPEDRPAEPWDTAKHGAPDPSWPLADQLHWFSRYSHVLLLNVSQHCRDSAAREADKAIAGRDAGGEQDA